MDQRVSLGNDANNSVEPELLDIKLDPENFIKNLLLEIVANMEETMGVEEASAYVSSVGKAVGEALLEKYKNGLDAQRFDSQTVAKILVDLKRRIDGKFYIVDVSPSHIDLRNTHCPFGERVADKPSLCMMTSNVFGKICSENFGFAKVELKETIARGCARCDIRIHLDPVKSYDVPGREYFGADPNTATD